MKKTNKKNIFNKANDKTYQYFTYKLMQYVKIDKHDI